MFSFDILSFLGGGLSMVVIALMPHVVVRLRGDKNLEKAVAAMRELEEKRQKAMVTALKAVNQTGPLEHKLAELEGRKVSTEIVKFEEPTESMEKRFDISDIMLKMKENPKQHASLANEAENRLLNTMQSYTMKRDRLDSQINQATYAIAQRDKRLEKNSEILSENKAYFEGYPSLFENYKKYRETLIARVQDLESRFEKQYVNILPSLVFTVEEAEAKLPLALDKSELEVPDEKMFTREKIDMNSYVLALRRLKDALDDLDNYRSKVHIITARYRTELRGPTAKTVTNSLGGDDGWVRKLLSELSDIERKKFKNGDPVTEFANDLKSINNRMKGYGIKLPKMSY